MQRSLENYAMPTEYQERLSGLAGQGIIIKTGDIYDLVPLRRMFENSTMRNWMHLVCRKAEQNKLHEMIVVRQGDEAIGYYCQYNYLGMLDRVGPFGMSEAMRGKGVGTWMWKLSKWLVIPIQIILFVMLCVVVVKVFVNKDNAQRLNEELGKSGIVEVEKGAVSGAFGSFSKKNEAPQREPERKSTPPAKNKQVNFVDML